MKEKQRGRDWDLLFAGVWDGGFGEKVITILISILLGMRCY